jgi:hypothetical protein
MENVSKNILKLDKISKKDRLNTVKNVSDTLLLLQGHEVPEEITMLKQIGLDGHIKKAETAKKNIQKFTVYEQKYGRNVYAGTQIKQYCEDNGYKMIRVDRFKYEIPLEVGKAIIGFNEENTFDHEKSEDRVVKRSRIDLQPQNFFLLMSIQSIYGAPVKSATLFYREEYDRDFYDVASEKDMLVEVFSWGKPGSDRNLFWYYAKATDYLIIFPIIFLLIGIVCVFLSENSHGVMLFLMICSVVAIFSSKKPSFFKWN